MVAIPMLMAAVKSLKVGQREPFDNNPFDIFLKPSIPHIIINGIYWFLHLLLSMYAVYLSFVRNGGFAFGPLVAAFCYPICYLIYHLAVPV